MATVQPQNEEIRKAARWIMEERRYNPQKKLDRLIQEASIKYDLSPMETEFLERFVRHENL